MGQQDFLPLGCVDNLIDFPASKKDDLGRIIAGRVELHLVYKIRQHPDSGQQALIELLQAVLGGAVEPACQIRPCRTR